MDGKYRKIEVKPTAAGLKVRARKGYLAVTCPPCIAIKSGGDIDAGRAQSPG